MVKSTNHRSEFVEAVVEQQRGSPAKVVSVKTYPRMKFLTNKPYELTFNNKFDSASKM